MAQFRGEELLAKPLSLKSNSNGGNCTIQRLSMKNNSDVDAVGERGGGVGDGDCEGLKRRRRREVEEWRDEGEVVLGEDEAAVATDGADEVTVAGAGDGEFGGEADCLWVGPHDLNVNGKKEFEQQMEVLGRLRHPNLIGLKAYYFARDEKLLVHEFMPNGNLFWLLHGKKISPLLFWIRCVRNCKFLGLC